ncbi:hypothetical protein SADUNF_Sadunf19G0052300 [Salix dunnii]|uniref:Uncharacterized protein n=1 Tax=Salix dunnii TaxID=1413687 RepID=A0A835J1W2_9ROSI|nr:hypothetical protein SADUNF_Sadunf19G0052300 [Salix dunnii]
MPRTKKINRSRSVLTDPEDGFLFTEKLLSGSQMEVMNFEWESQFTFTLPFLFPRCYIQHHFVGSMTSGRPGSSCRSLPSSDANLAVYLIDMLDMENLLVTSTLAVCTDPYPQALEKPGETDKPSEELQVQSSLVQNGVEPAVVGDGDEIMTEVEEADIDDDMTIDMEALEEIVASSETNSTSTGNS